MVVNHNDVQGLLDPVLFGLSLFLAVLLVLLMLGWYRQTTNSYRLFRFSIEE